VSAMPDKVVQFVVPKKPRVFEKDPLPDQRKVSVLPFKAVFDKELSHGGLQVLAALCTYTNRAGITWVSQTRLANELKISQQAVAKQFKQLRQLGYLETIRKGFKGERTDTLRVIFDESVDAETAIAVTSSIEDTRSPVMKREQLNEMDIDKAGQQKVANLISQALKKPTKKEFNMPKSGQTRTVRQMHEQIAKAKSKTVDKTVDNSSHTNNLEVVNVGELHSQPNHNLEVVYNPLNIIYKEYIRLINIRLSIVLHNQNEIELLKYFVDGDITPAMVDLAISDLLAAAGREGVEPPKRLEWWMHSIIEHRSDALTRHLEASTSPVKP